MRPNLIIIGAMKCGTSSLKDYLGRHPDVCMAKDKGLQFFYDDEEWEKGPESYESHFALDAKVVGEKNTAYSNCRANPLVAERMHSFIPDAKLIFMVRDPIDRMVSHYVHNLAKDREALDISQALLGPDNAHYLSVSRYWMQLERYLQFYPKSAIMVVTLRELGGEPQETMGRVFRFIGVDDSFYSDDFTNPRHQSKKKRTKNAFGFFMSRVPGFDRLAQMPPRRWRKRIRKLTHSEIGKVSLPEADREKLADILREDANKLREFTGLDLGHWSV